MNGKWLMSDSNNYLCQLGTFTMEFNGHANRVWKFACLAWQRLIHLCNYSVKVEGVPRVIKQESWIWNIPGVSYERDLIPSNRCIVCSNTRTKDDSISLHHYPSDSEQRKLWPRFFSFTGKWNQAPHACGGGATSPLNLALSKLVSLKKWWQMHKCRNCIYDSKCSARTAAGMLLSESSTTAGVLITLLMSAIRADQN